MVQVVAGHEAEFAAQQEAARVARAELRGETSTPTSTTPTSTPILRPSAVSPEVSEKLMSGEAATVTEAQTQIVEEAMGYATPAEAKALGVSRVKTGEEYIEVTAKSGKILKVPKSEWTPQMKAQYKETRTVYGTRFTAPRLRESGQWVVVTDPREASRVASLFLEEGVEIPYTVGRIERRRVEDKIQYKIISKEDVETQRYKAKAERLWEKASMEEKARIRMSTILSPRGYDIVKSVMPFKPHRKREDIYKEHLAAAVRAEKKGKRAEFIASSVVNPIVQVEVAVLGGLALRAATVAGTTTKIIAKTGVSTELIKWAGYGASVVGTASEVAMVREDIAIGDYQAAAARVFMDVASIAGFAYGWKLGEPKPVYKVKQPVGFEERTEAISSKRLKGAELEKVTDIKYIEYETTKRPKIVVPERVAYEAGEMERAIAGGREVRTVKRGTRVFDIVEGKVRWADKDLKGITMAFKSDVPAGELLREKRVWAVFKDQTIPKGAKIIKTDAYKMLESIDDIVGATGMGSSFKYSFTRAVGTKLITIPGLAHAQVEKIVYVKKIPFLPLVKTTTFRKVSRDQARVTMKIYPTVKIPSIAKVKEKYREESLLTRIIKPPKEAEFSRVGKLKPPFKPVKPKPPKPDIPILEPPKRKRVLRLEEWEREKYGKMSKKQIKQLLKKRYLFEEATGVKLKKKVRQEEKLGLPRLIGLQVPGRVDRRMDQFLEQQMGKAVLYGFRLPSRQRVALLTPSMADIITLETVGTGGLDLPKYRKEPREPRARRGKAWRKGYEEKLHPGDIMELIGARPSRKTKRKKRKSEFEGLII